MRCICGSEGNTDTQGDFRTRWVFPACTLFYKTGLTQNEFLSTNLREFSLIVLKFAWIGED
jgi:hypothetical protein